VRNYAPHLQSLVPAGISAPALFWARELPVAFITDAGMLPQMIYFARVHGQGTSVYGLLVPCSAQMEHPQSCRTLRAGQH